MNDKFELIKTLGIYAAEHKEVIPDKIVREAEIAYKKMCDYICEEVCGGAYHCTDGCPVWDFQVELKRKIENDNNVSLCS